MTLRTGELDGEKPMTPHLDVARRRLTLPRHLVPVGLLMLQHRDATSVESIGPGLTILERAGIASNGRLHQVAERILGPVAAPAAVVSVEVRDRERISIGTFWIRGLEATVGTSQDRELFDLHSVEPGLLPFHLAALTGTTPRPMCPHPPIIIGGDDLDSARHGDPTVNQLLSAPARRWKVSTLWSEADGFVGDHTLEVLETDSLGSWELTRLPESNETVLTPRSFDSLLRLLADTVPF